MWGTTHPQLLDDPMHKRWQYLAVCARLATPVALVEGLVALVAHAP